MSRLLVAAAVLLICLLAVDSGTRSRRGPASTPERLDGRPLPVERLEVQGLTRTVRFYVPASIRDDPTLIIALHGGGGDGARFRRLTDRAFESVAEEHGLLVAYPDGLGGHWNGCRSRAAYRPALAGVDDGAFLRAVAGRAREIAGRELAGVFVVGYSNGGHLAFRLALESPTDFDGYAVIGASLPIPAQRGCRDSGKGVSMLLVSGTDDPINPWEGGRVEAPGGAELGSVVSARATISHFVGLAAPTAPPRVVRYEDRPPDDGTRVEAHGWVSAGGTEVLWMIVRGGGHTLPHREGSFPVSLTGPSSHDIDGASEIWKFFARQLPAGPEPFGRCAGLSPGAAPAHSADHTPTAAHPRRRCRSRKNSHAHEGLWTFRP